MDNSSQKQTTHPAFDELEPVQVERLTKIQLALQAHGHLSYKQIAEIVETSVSSARRGVEFLRERCNHPIDFNPDKNGWGYTGEVAGVPTMQISDSEVSALHFTKNAVKDLRGTCVHRHFVSGFKKIVGAMTKKLSRRLRRWDEVISIHTRIQPIFDSYIFDTIARQDGCGRSAWFD